MPSKSHETIPLRYPDFKIKIILGRKFVQAYGSRQASLRFSLANYFDMKRLNYPISLLKTVPVFEKRTQMSDNYHAKK
jgi:hypothetical protein